MHCSTTCGAFKVTEKFPMDAPLVNGKEIAVELRAVCKEARQRKTREDDDRRRGEREREGQSQDQGQRQEYDI